MIVYTYIHAQVGSIRKVSCTYYLRQNVLLWVWRRWWGWGRRSSCILHRKCQHIHSNSYRNISDAVVLPNSHTSILFQWSDLPRSDLEEVVEELLGGWVEGPCQGVGLLHTSLDVAMGGWNREVEGELCTQTYTKCENEHVTKQNQTTQNIT